LQRCVAEKRRGSERRGGREDEREEDGMRSREEEGAGVRVEGEESHLRRLVSGITDVGIEALSANVTRGTQLRILDLT